MNSSRMGGLAATAAVSVAVVFIFPACAPPPVAAPAATSEARLSATRAPTYEPAVVAPTAKPAEGHILPEQDAHQMDADPAFAEYQLAFGDLVRRFQEEFPGDYAGHRFNAAHSSGTIVFAGDVPSGAMQLLETVPNVTGEGNAGYTYAGRTASERELYQQVADAFEDIPYLANLDHPSNTLKVSYDATNKSAPAAAAVLTEAIAVISIRGNGVKLVMTPFEGPPIRSQEVDAGVPGIVRP